MPTDTRLFLNCSLKGGRQSIQLTMISNCMVKITRNYTESAVWIHGLHLTTNQKYSEKRDYVCPEHVQTLSLSLCPNSTM